MRTSRAGPGRSATPVATGVDVLAVPVAEVGDAGAGTTVGAAPPGSLVVVAVDPAEVGTLTQASATGFVTFAWADP